MVKDFVNLTLAGKPEQTTAPTVTEDVTTVPIDTQAPTQEEQTEQAAGGCHAAVCSACLLALIPLAACVLKKKQ